MALSEKRSTDAIAGAARLMIEGLEKRKELLSGVGITDVEIAGFKESYDEMLADDAKQEELKAALKSQTAKASNSQDAVLKSLSKLTKLVKIAIEKEDWRTFGIDDKR